MILHEQFDAEEVLKTIEREKVTYVGAVPTMCERMLHVLETKKYDTSSLRCLAITGGKVHPAVLEAIEQEYHAEHLSDLCVDRFRPDGDFQTRPTWIQAERRGTAGLVCRFAHCR